MINLGKEPGTKGYRLYDPNSRQVYVSKDVVFDKTKCWNWDTDEGSVTEQLDTFFVFDTISTEMGEQNEYEGNIDDLEVSTPRSQTRNRSVEADMYDDSTTPKKFRPLSDIYNETEEIEIEDELMLMGID